MSEHGEQVSCKHSWVPTYVSKDESGTVIAHEFRCKEHQVNFWLAIPAPTLEADLKAEKERAERLELALRRIHELALTRQSVAEIGRRAGAALGLSTPEETDAH